MKMDMGGITRLFKRAGISIKRSAGKFLLVALLVGLGLPASESIAQADNTLEYQVKAAFIYNFLVFTQWPESEQTIHLCHYGEDYFGNELDKLQNKSVHRRAIKVVRIREPDQLTQCQAVFFSRSTGGNLTNILDGLEDAPILTLADSPNAISKGVIINMNLVDGKIVFEINLGIARKSGLDLSSKLLQLAIKVYQ